MMAVKKEDFDEKAEIIGAGISFDHSDTADMSLNPENRQDGNI